MFFILFRDITLADKPVFDDVFRRVQYSGSECTFTNLFIWRSCYDIRWAWEDGFLLIQVTREKERFLLPPLGGEDAALPSVLEKLCAHFGPFEMRGIYREIVEKLEDILPGRFAFYLDRSNSDYIYLADNLASLAGRKYHQKKNHVNSFRKAYPNYRYLPMDKNITVDCLAFAQEWKESRDGAESDESLLCEMSAITEALTNFGALGIQGGVIVIDGKVEAMTFGEMLNADTAVIHVEKANPAIRGLYAVINQEFCQRAWAQVKYINREEDMGIEGLRKAKLSYQPKYLLDKFTAKINFGAGDADKNVEKA
ncbi:MAG: phosphatidylglycerol lysyltransferase domain-containing protein [Acidaminococcales bacterium]|nr:phosphatidylglycerol lysyltransferase domain-containing protein [Acidaminococcales bacterium]